MLVVLVAAMPLRAGVTITREKCDELLAELPRDPWLKTRDGSALAWGEAANIHAILDLYDATGDHRYLQKVVRRGDQMLSHRDDRRGFKDWSGKAHKAWSMAMKYTVAEGFLTDASGRRVIRLRSTPYAYNDQTKVEVTTSEGRFSLHVANGFWKRDETFSDLSIDPESPRYFERIVNNPRTKPSCTPGKCTERSELLSATPLAERIGVPKSQSLTLEPIPLAYCGYVGIIYHPLLRFAEMVRADASLKEFAPAAQRFTHAADESYEEFRDHWRSGPGEDEGYYICCKRGGPFVYDNIGEPFNYLGAHVSSEIALYRLTGKLIYKDHVRRMANLFKHRLKLMPGDLYVWNYWYEPITTGWTREDDVSDNLPELAARVAVEDVSHATLDIQLVLNAARAGIVFDHTDLRRFANTFLQNVFLPDGSGFNGRVDGTGRDSRYAKAGVTGWLPLAEVDPAVYEGCRKVYVSRGRDAFRPLARLLKWEKRRGVQSR